MQQEAKLNFRKTVISPCIPTFVCKVSALFLEPKIFFLQKSRLRRRSWKSSRVSNQELFMVYFRRRKSTVPMFQPEDL
ncbi:unnamed protein product [Allacma fusca]|uniref:Uncharacterized protein n=1 Tax=Allacma fusca TaxID=39272 RepID=A0A8J2LD78_9HEXA|nr:unnamed protein product [Allacma fusca]